MASFVSGGGGSDRHSHRGAEGNDERDMNDLISSYYDLDNDDDDDGSGGYDDARAEPGMDLNSPQFDAPLFTQRRLTEMGLKCDLMIFCSDDRVCEYLPQFYLIIQFGLCWTHFCALIFVFYRCNFHDKCFHILQHAHPSVPTRALTHSQRPRIARQ
jgi:hypothetical protein